MGFIGHFPLNDESLYIIFTCQSHSTVNISLRRSWNYTTRVDVRIRAYLRTKQGDWLASQPDRFILAFSFSRALSPVQTDEWMGTP